MYGTIRRVLIRALVGAAAAAVLVAGCTSGGGSAPSRTPTASATSVAPSSPTPTPTATRTGPLTTGPGVRPGEQPPVLDPLGNRHDGTGAFVVAGYFIRAVDWSIATNDPYLIEQIAAPSCDACRTYIAGLRQLKTKRESQEGGRLIVKTVRADSGSFKVKADYVFRFSLTQTPVVLHRPEQPAATTQPAQTFTSLVFVSWISSRWVVIEQGSP